MRTCLAWIRSLYTWEQTAPHQHPNEATEKCLMSRLIQLPLADVTLNSRRVKKSKTGPKNMNKMIIAFFPYLFFCLVSEHAPETVGAPLELVTSEVTARNFRVSWSPAPGKVEKYRVVYYAARGGEPHEVPYWLFFLRLQNTFYIYWGKAKGVNIQYKHIHHSTKLRNICVIARCAAGEVFRPGCTLFSIIFTAPVGGNDLRPPEQPMDCSQV